MSDRRLTPANTRVAAEHLRGTVDAARFTAGEPRYVAVGVVDVLRAPGGARDRQFLMGAKATLFDTQDGWAFVQFENGYVGYVPDTALGEAGAPTHRVCTRATHVYSTPDIKAPELLTLSYGARISVMHDIQGEEAEPRSRFVQTALGYVPRSHLVPVTESAADPVAEAERLLGTPYLWGGDSAFGIDCSGLVKAALDACGVPCPGDSDLQTAALGRTLPPGTTPRRGDILFWGSHVGWVAGPDTLLHANAHSMSVAYEPLTAAIARIESQGEGPVTRHARLIEEASV